MTEAEWLACEVPAPMLEFARHRVSRRKFRLFACACCWRAPDASTHDHGEEAIGLAERLADGLETNATRAEALRELWAEANGGLSFEELMAAPITARPLPPICCFALESNPVTAAKEAAYWVSRNSGEERAILCSLLRDVFSNPFCPPIAFAPEWRTDTVLSLAKQMYESREFSAMPILADALQDAGCDSDDILSHCRSDEPHVRECWVVDGVLGKE